MSENPYLAPQSDVRLPDTTIVGGSIEETLAGRGRLEVGAVLGEAWDRLEGSKSILLGGFVLLNALLFVLGKAVTALLSILGINASASIMWQLILQLGLAVVLYPFVASVILTAVRHMTGSPISFADLFGSSGKTARLLGAGLLVQVLTLLGFVCLIIPGIYLSIAYIFTGALIVERDMGMWEAMEMSRKLVTKHWLTVFLITLLVGVLTGLSAIFLLIPLIWTVPWGLLCIGVIYRNLVGIQTR